tara:strand:+ start:2938 stop:4029 length:1092 start_codon:yes stop_codon:yes gene_type:complete
LFINSVTFEGKNTLSLEVVMLEEFPPIKHSIYFNTAYVGLMPMQLSEFRQAHDQDYFLNGDLYKLDAYATIEKKGESVASFFGASKNQTILVSNFSESIRFALSMLPKSMRFLLLKEDYPSLTLAVKEAGFESTEIPVSYTLETDIETIIESKKIDVLALSVVQYISGIEIDQDFLLELKKKYPDLLIIGDGTQFLGTAPFNFTNSPFDVLAASGYKWLMAGFGNGVLFFSDYFKALINKSHDQIIEKYYVGHFNILAIASLAKAIELIQARGFSQMLDRKKHLTTLLNNGLLDLKLISPLISNRKKHSSIFAIPDKKNLFEKLIEKNIRCAQRGGFIRISLHFYNSEKDVEILLSFLKDHAI